VAAFVARFGMSGLALSADGRRCAAADGLTGLGAAVRFIPRMVVIGLPTASPF